MEPKAIHTILVGVIGMVIFFATARFWLAPSKDQNAEKSNGSWKVTWLVVIGLIVLCVAFVALLK